jgi:hypothetical protein
MGPAQLTSSLRAVGVACRETWTRVTINRFRHLSLRTGRNLLDPERGNGHGASRVVADREASVGDRGDGGVKRFVRRLRADGRRSDREGHQDASAHDPVHRHLRAPSGTAGRASVCAAVHAPGNIAAFDTSTDIRRTTRPIDAYPHPASMRHVVGSWDVGACHYWPV